MPNRTSDHGDQLAAGPVAEPVLVLTRVFPARPASFVEIRQLVRRALFDAPLDDDANRALLHAVERAVLDAAGPEGASVQVSFRIFADAVEVDVLRPAASADELPFDAAGDEPPFAAWIAGVIRREGLSQEAAARQLGASVKTVSRWVGGLTEPRLRELRRIRDVFGDVPIR